MSSGWLAPLMAAAPALAGGASAQSPGGLMSAEQVSPVRVVADREVVAAGETLRLAVVFDVVPKWHVYWKDAGAGGMPPRVRVTAPDGYSVGEPLFTRPRVFDSPAGEEYGYADQAVVFVDVIAPASLDEGSLHLEVAIDWAVCDEICLLGRAQREVALKTTRRRVTELPLASELIRRHERRLPRPLRELEDATIVFDGDTLRIEGPASGRRSATFFPHRSPGVEYGDVRVTVSGDRFRVTVAIELDSNNSLDGPMVIAGLVGLGEGFDEPSYDFRVELTDERERGAPR